MIDLCPLCSSTRNTYVKKYVSVVVPTTDRTRTLNSRPFQSQVNSIFYSFHVLTFLLPRKKGRNPDTLHRRHGNPSFSSTLGRSKSCMMKLTDSCELSTVIFNFRDNRDPNQARTRSHKEEQKKRNTHTQSRA